VPSNRLRRLLVAGSIAAVTVLSLLGPGAGAAGALPPKPVPPAPVKKTTQGAVLAAQSERSAAATQVGQLSAQIAAMQNRIDVLNGKAEQAEQRYALAYSELQKAKDAEAAAEAHLEQAARQVTKAHDRFVETVRATYMDGDIAGMGGAVLTADDPSVLLEQTTLQQYLTAHKADAVGEFQTATVARANDQAAATRATLARKKAEQDAKAAKDDAFARVAQAKQERAGLEQQMAAKRQLLNEKQAILDVAVQDRAAYTHYLDQLDTYKDQLGAYNDAKREAEARAEAARQRAAERARERAARRHHGGGGGGGGGGGSGGGGWSSGPPAPSGGSWRADKARRAVNRARSQLGVPYAWAGGGVGGPSYGVCDGSNGAPNDCNVRGFDCSGLVMYAWGQGWAHYAATQYTQAGSVHPSLGNLKPGDLLFWSFNGSIGGIHHVAMYIGGGQIIQAPESGSYVMISSMYAPGAIFGATRPLT
jgi:cell wall-associated NlpC family hydrolase